MKKIFELSKSQKFQKALDKTFEKLESMSLKEILEIPSKKNK